jgi:hypothetical protein
MPVDRSTTTSVSGPTASASTAVPQAMAASAVAASGSAAAVHTTASALRSSGASSPAATWPNQRTWPVTPTWVASHRTAPVLRRRRGPAGNSSPTVAITSSACGTRRIAVITWAAASPAGPAGERSTSTTRCRASRGTCGPVGLKPSTASPGGTTATARRRTPRRRTCSCSASERANTKDAPRAASARSCASRRDGTRLRCAAGTPAQECRPSRVRTTEPPGRPGGGPPAPGQRSAGSAGSAGPPQAAGRASGRASGRVATSAARPALHEKACTTCGPSPFNAEASQPATLRTLASGSDPASPGHPAGSGSSAPPGRPGSRPDGWRRTICTPQRLCPRAAPSRSSARYSTTWCPLVARAQASGSTRT